MTINREVARIASRTNKIDRNHVYPLVMNGDMRVAQRGTSATGVGASNGYEKVLELSGVGYRAALKDKNLNLQLGFSHDVNFPIPEGINITVNKQTSIVVKGSDKQLVGMVVSKIKSLRPPEPYKGKGIKEKGQYILRKEGKKK